MTGRSCLKTILSHTEKDVNILWGEEIIFIIDKLECSEMIIEGLLLEKKWAGCSNIQYYTPILKEAWCYFKNNIYEMDVQHAWKLNQ